MEHTLVLSNVTQLAQSLEKFSAEYLPLIQETVQRISNKKLLKKNLKNRKGAVAHTISKEFDGKSVNSLYNSIELCSPEKTVTKKSRKTDDKTLVTFIMSNYDQNPVNMNLITFILHKFIIVQRLDIKPL